jgi:hypothetical protein
MSWLIGYTLASMAAAFIAIRIFDYVVSGATDNLARASVFVVTWTAVTAQSAMRGVSKSAQKLRQRSADVKSLLGRSLKDDRSSIT